MFFKAFSNKTHMNKTFVLLFSILITLSLSTTSVLAQATTITNPGITPDNFLYGLDVFIDNIRLAITAGDIEKAKLSLQIAEERLAEVKVMIEQNKLAEAQTAQAEHDKNLAVTETSVGQIARTNATEEIKEEINVEKALKQHKAKVETVSGELKVKIKVKGELTAEQQGLIDSILSSMEGKSGEVEIKIDNKKQETKIKIKQQTGKSDEEIEDEVEELEIEAGVAGLEVKAEIVGNQAEMKIEKEFSTSTTDRDAIINEIIQEFAFDRETADTALEIETEETDEELEEEFKVEVKVEEGIAEVEIELKFILNTTDRDTILDAIVERSQLTKEQIEEVLEFETEEEEETEIEVEIEDGIAKIKVEFASEELEFELETTDKEIIISEIIERTGLTRAQIESIIEFEEETEEDEEED